jgi:hypothetical protein
MRSAAGVETTSSGGNAGEAGINFGTTGTWVAIGIASTGQPARPGHAEWQIDFAAHINQDAI